MLKRLRIVTGFMTVAAVFFAVLAAVPAQAAGSCSVGEVAWGPLTVPPASGGSDNTPDFGLVLTNMWNYHSGDVMTMWGSGLSNPAWDLCYSSPNSAVQGYPEAQANQSGAALSTYNSISSSASWGWLNEGAGTPPSGTSADIAWDTWWYGVPGDSKVDEVMFWAGRYGSATPAGTDTGVQVTTSGDVWTLWFKAGSGGTGAVATWVRSNDGTPTAHILTLMNYLASNAPYDNGTTGFGTDPTFKQSNWGIEVRSTSSNVMGWQTTALSYTVN